MNKSKDVVLLLALLDEPKIIDKIRSITSSEDTSKPEDSIIQTLRDELNALQEAHKADLLKLNETSALLADLRDALHKEQQNRQECELKLNDQVRVQGAFLDFLVLPQGVRLALRGIFKQDTFDNFVACGSQRDNIEALWDFIKFRIMDCNLEALETLVKILYFCQDTFNGTAEQPLLLRDEIAAGDPFDVTRHIRTPDGKVSGTVGEVMLLGYTNASTRGVIRKTIVRVV